MAAWVVRMITRSQSETQCVTLPFTVTAMSLWLFVGVDRVWDVPVVGP
jgi:hypothetical protein